MFKYMMFSLFISVVAISVAVMVGTIAQELFRAVVIGMG